MVLAGALFSGQNKPGAAPDLCSHNNSGGVRAILSAAGGPFLFETCPKNRLREPQKPPQQTGLIYKKMVLAHTLFSGQNKPGA